MAKQLYGYSPSYGGPGATNLSAVYASKPIPSVADSYLSSSAPSSAYSSAAAAAERVSSFLLNKTASDAGYASWAAGADDPGVPGLKRPSEALYHQTVMGAYNTIEQSEAWFSSNTLAKRTRLESAGNYPIYPQRPGEKDCAHYMQTRTCKFGDMCKYDHPIWVPEGGIPDWKEVPLAATSEYLPERPGELDCPYFLKTQKCKFGLKCKFNHPKDVLVSSATFGDVDATSLPERPSEPPCSFYMKTGKCKYGGTCKFHHPKDILASSTGLDNDSGSQSASLMVETMNTMLPANPALMHNSKGLPVRPGEVDCPFYMKTGSCKYGATCRFNHPDRYAINPPAATFGHAFLASPATLNVGVVNPSTSILQATDPRLTQTMLGLEPTAYPQRPGQIECDFYMKTGACKFGERCRFHHPIDRSAPTLSMVKQAVEQNVKLTLAGLPRRENSVICPYYLKTATCKFGATCKFDHPPPGEVMKISAPQGTSMSPKEEPGKGVQA